jgi:hypothetical protein
VEQLGWTLVMVQLALRPTTVEQMAGSGDMRVHVESQVLGHQASLQSLLLEDC